MNFQVYFNHFMRFGFVNSHDFRELTGHRSNNDLDRLYSQTIMFSIRQLYISISRPKSSTLSMKSYVQAFFRIWACRKKGQGQP